MNIPMSINLTQQKLEDEGNFTSYSFRDKLDKIARMAADATKIEDSISQSAKDKIAEAKALRKTVKTLTSKLEEEVTAYVQEQGQDDDAIVVLEGECCTAELSARGKKREVADLYGIRDALEARDEGLFMQLASIALKHIDTYLSPVEYGDCVVTHRVNRRLKIKHNRSL